MKTVIAFRSFDEDITNQSEFIHSPSTGLEIYPGQKIEAKITSDQLSTEFLPIYRISPMGAEIDVSGVRHFLGTGSEIGVNIRIGKQVCVFEGLVVARAYKVSDRDIIGVRWVSDENGAAFEKDRRSGLRWLCGDEFLPSGIAPNPARFNDFVYFRLTDVSKDGLRFRTSLRNKLLIPGMVLDSTVSFPLVGQVHLQFKIANISSASIDGKEMLSVGVKVLNHDRPTLETLGQYVLQFGPQTTVSDLKKSGLFIQSTASALEFSFVKTKEDYIDVLRLRKQTYSDVGKFDEDQNFEKMGDEFDTKSRILIARHRGKVVGSARVAFHSKDDTHEYDSFVKFPDTFPNKTEMLVASRVCTDPSYRGNDLIYSIVKQVYLVAIQSKRKFILGGSSDALLPFYEKLGFRGTGLYFEHSGLNNNREQIILADATRVLSAEDCSIGIWTKYFQDLSDYLVNYYDFEVSSALKFKLMTLSFFGKIRSVLRI